MDRISRLPDDVICHILSFLPTKHAVATSVLSSRWVNLWSFVPVIDLDDSLCLKALNPSRISLNIILLFGFLERILSVNQSQTIAKFRLCMHYRYIGPALSKIDVFVQNLFLRNVVEIDLEIFSGSLDHDDWCLKIPHSQTLEVLKVRTDYALKMSAFPGCFPSLRVFDAKFSVDPEDDMMTNLFPCLPALEKLCLVADLAGCIGDICFNVSGDALKHVDLQLLIYNYAECDAMVVIDAPKLEYLRLQDEYLAPYIVKHKPTISEVRLHVGEDEEFLEILEEVGPTRLTRFTELLQGLVNAKCISVSASTLTVIFSQSWNLPVMPYVTKLELEVPARSWILLLHWLQSCPNLKVLSLIIKEKHGEEFEEGESTVPEVVPSCLSSRVKEIEIKRLGKVDEEEMLKYLLYNATVLDNFKVDSRVYIKDGILF